MYKEKAEMTMYTDTTNRQGTTRTTKQPRRHSRVDVKGGCRGPLLFVTAGVEVSGVGSSGAVLSVVDSHWVVADTKESCSASSAVMMNSCPQHGHGIATVQPFSANNCIPGGEACVTSQENSINSAVCRIYRHRVRVRRGCAVEARAT